MLGSRRQSLVSPGPLSPSAISHSNSSTGQNSNGHSRASFGSDTASTVAGTTGGESLESRNVKVVLRIRPSDPNDSSIPPRFRSVLVHPTSRAEIRVDVDPATLAGYGAGATNPSSKRHPTFVFDNVLGEDAQQTDLYEATARDSVEEFMKGHNVTFLAYGQTSSGKSYSMGTTGDDVDYSGVDFTPRTGLIPRTVQTIFERAEDAKQNSGPGATWEARLSFLELYNEEIIDLLSGTGVSISIREERDGRIIWSGVREIKVKSLVEVMQLLQEGSTRRKTGETTMNTSSSRSHAIFSLTLVQKRMSHSLSSRSETPTRQLRRPNSMVGFSGSAGPRSPTPSSGRGGPPSSFSRLSTPSRPSTVIGNPAFSNDDYIIITSKFNMVDLAGSERLKRTAAQGDRMKEGISINSGLLALGNVISALCDPVKARGHIPYRDSKLTRMLQDSIGGNSLTTMIACISPIEANIGETLNTIKYASRARNIRNQAKINQVEAGWDDVEYLQNTVSKLRRQLTAVDAEGKSTTIGEEAARQSEKLVRRLAELQREHTELYDRYLGKCSENMRLSSELRNRGPGDGDALTKFNETVEPVILEYEKVVSALNQQLDELRGELAIMNDMSEEHTHQLQEMRDRQIQSETYVTELRVRLGKLIDSNRSLEAYVQDLEAKLKNYGDKEDSNASVVVELKKEISKLKKEGKASLQIATDFEAKLSNSETQQSQLLSQIKKQEDEAGSLEKAYHSLESQVDKLSTIKDNQLLVAELVEKDERIAALEQQLEEKVAIEQRKRELLNAEQLEKAAQEGLTTKLALPETKSSVTSVLGTPPTDPIDGNSTLAAENATAETTIPDSEFSSSADTDELKELRAALEKLSAEYARSESRIADLVTQLSEAKLVQGEVDDMVLMSSSTPGPATDKNSDIDEDTSGENETVLTPVKSSPSSSPTKRRTSMRRISMPIFEDAGIAVKQGFRGGRGFTDSKGIRPQSLSQELLFAQSSALSPRASWNQPITKFATPLFNAQFTSRPSSRSSQSLEAELKIVHRIIEERDEELRDREACIQELQEDLEKERKHNILSLQSRAKEEMKIPKTPIISVQPTEIPLPPSPETPLPLKLIEERTLKEGVEGLKPPEYGLDEGKLSPSSAKRFNLLADHFKALENGHGAEDEQSKIEILMKEMAEKEASQRRIIEQQFVQIADLQKANYKLKEELTETEPQLLAAESIRQERDLLIAEKNKAPNGLPSPGLSPRQISIHSQTFEGNLGRPRDEHDEELRAIISGHTQTIEVLQHEHKAELEKLHNEIDAKQTTIEKNAAIIESLKLEQHTTLTQLRRSMDERDMSFARELEALKATHSETVSSLKAEHAKAIAALQEEQDLVSQEMESSLSVGEEQRRQLKMKADQVMFELSRVRDEHSLQKNSDARQMAELTKSNALLEKAKAELEKAHNDLKTSNAELSKRNSELEQRFGRKLVPPPQGPPPTTPLPPIPRSPTENMLKLDNITSFSGQMDKRQSESSAGHSEPSSEAGTHTLYAVLAERDGLRNEVGKEKDKIKEIETKLQEEKVKVNNLAVDLREAQKIANNLRTHLDDARQESKRVIQACREHTAELEARQEQLSKISEEQRIARDSLQASQAQATSLKMQLERAVEKKVAKRGLRVGMDGRNNETRLMDY
nr:hypothetical protein L204_03052 [Cryptococcus depauperatus CBS 7855]